MKINNVEKVKEALTVLELKTEGLVIEKNDVEQQYKILALKYHPDKNPSPESEEMIKKINNARETIRKVFNNYKTDKINISKEGDLYVANEVTNNYCESNANYDLLNESERQELKDKFELIKVNEGILDTMIMYRKQLSGDKKLYSEFLATQLKPLVENKKAGIEKILTEAVAPKVNQSDTNFQYLVKILASIPKQLQNAGFKV